MLVSIPTGRLEAELQALSDEELEARLAELSGVSVEELRAWTPEEDQRRDDETLAALSEADVLDLMRQAPRVFHGLPEGMAGTPTRKYHIATSWTRYRRAYRAPRFGSQR